MRKANGLKFDFDAAADVLQVSFGTGEPSFSEEINDLLVMEYGIYSGAPTGFQVLHVREIGLDAVAARLKRSLPRVRNREAQILSKLAAGRGALLRRAVRALAEKREDLVAA
ncbi:MAG: DUF2283 domain-containing protein [Verrucomicrobia bacterium]|nr:DUF2283 domain-containing protein [Verrucomicrobiota bacterium]